MGIGIPLYHTPGTIPIHPENHSTTITYTLKISILYFKGPTNFDVVTTWVAWFQLQAHTRTNVAPTSSVYIPCVHLLVSAAVQVMLILFTRPKHHLTLQQVKDIIQYILNYTGRKKSYTCICRPACTGRSAGHWSSSKKRAIQDLLTESLAIIVVSLHPGFKRYISYMSFLALSF